MRSGDPCSGSWLLAKTFVVWVSQIDSRTTVICLDMHGQVVQSDELFVGMSGSLQSPPAHWGCRSVLDVRSLATVREVSSRDRRNQGRRFERSERRTARQAMSQRRREIGRQRWNKLVERARVTNPPPGVQYLTEIRSRGPIRLMEIFAEETGSLQFGPIRPPVASELRRSLDASLRSGVVAEERLGKSAVSRVRFADGTEGIFRPAAARTDAERLALKVGERMGVNVPDSVATDRGLYQRFITDARTAGDIRNEIVQEFSDGLITKAQFDARLDAWRMMIESPKARQAGLFDYAVGNQDRHLFNWMVDSQDQVWLIDHNSAFSPRAISPFAEKYQTGWSAGEARAAIDQVSDLADEFAEAGLSDAFDAMTKRLAYVEEHGQFAPGTVLEGLLDDAGRMKT